MEYFYRALDKSGKEINGIVTALTLEEARKKLKESGLILIELRERTERQALKNTIKLPEAYKIFNHLSLLLKSGVNFDTALILCIDSVEEKKSKNILESILISVKAGKDVSTSFKETGAFSPLVISIIKVGEKIGNLALAFENIANYFLFNLKFKEEIKNAMVYPFFLIAASFIAIIGIFKIIIPRFFSVFTEGTRNLPLIAKVLYNISQLLNIKNLLFILMPLLITYFLVKRTKSVLFFPKLERFLFKIPFIKKFLIHLELSRFCFAMNSMLMAGLEFIQALNYASDILKYNFMRESLKKALLELQEGKRISKVFEEIDFFPPFFKGSIKIAEESGRMAEVFYQLYQFSEDQFKTSVKRFLTLLEPAIITIMGIIIGMIVLSLILTIMSVSNIKL